MICGHGSNKDEYIISTLLPFKLKQSEYVQRISDNGKLYLHNPEAEAKQSPPLPHQGVDIDYVELGSMVLPMASHGTSPTVTNI